MIGQKIARFECLAPLGKGGMGLVYLAHDPSLDRNVALKILSPQGSNRDDRIRRFAQEAKAASALNHPNIITIYEIDKVPGGPDFIAMELVEGETLHSLAVQGISIPMVFSIARQAAEALAVAHARGIIHRDIKPENIMVRRDGYVKVLDFGLASLQMPGKEALETATRISSDGMLIGTPAYMSPEQARGEPLTEATDIFSLGLVLYELATGRHPYPAHSTMAMLQAITSRAPVPPSRLRPEIPRTLEELILEMLDKDPGRRPRATAIMEALSEPDRNPPAVHSLPARPTSRVTVGRERELSELHSCLGDAASGKGILLCVTGEPGIGKTTLIEEFLSEISETALCVGRGRCSERLAGSEAYLPILEALEDLVHSPMGSHWAHLLRLFAPTWYVQMAPSSSDTTDQLRAEAKGASQERMKREITTFFQEVSRIRPLILFFDDLHWSDLSTVDILSYLGDRCRSMRLLILTTYRPSDLLLSKNPFHQVKLELQARGACREIVVGFLGTSEIEKYLAFAFAGHRFPLAFSALIHEQTEGNPLFMVDLLRYLRDRGVLVEAPGGGEWSLAQPVEDMAVGLPESVRSMIQRKVERLNDEDRRLMVAGSIQGSEFDSAVMSLALEMNAADVEERLDVLERVHGFVRLLRETTFPDGTPSLRYQFIHVLYQDALYDSLRPTRRASVSRSVAEALMKLHGDRSAAVAAELAFLLETSRDYARAIDHYLLAAQQAAQVSANLEAVNLCRRGLDLLRHLTDAPVRTQKEMLLLTVFSVSLSAIKGYTDSEVEAACSRGFELCRASEDGVAIYPMLTGIGAHAFMRPNLDRALEIINRLVHMAEASPRPEPRVWVHFVAGSVKSHAGDLAAALEHEEAGLRAYDPSRHIHYLLQFGLDPGIGCCAQAARVAWMRGFPERAQHYADQALALAAQHPHAYTSAFALFFAAVVAHYLRDSSRCLELARQLNSTARENSFPMFLGWGDSLYGWAEVETGSIERGIQKIEQGLDQNRKIGTGLMRPEQLGLLAMSLARRSNPDDAISTLDEAIETSEATKEIFCLPELLRLKANMLLRQTPDSAGEAERLLQKSLETARSMQALSFELRSATSLGWLLGDLGRGMEGRDLLASAYKKFAEGFNTPDLLDAQHALSSLNSGVDRHELP